MFYQVQRLRQERPLRQPALLRELRRPADQALDIMYMCIYIYT